jgi:hypothetical protein
VRIPAALVIGAAMLAYAATRESPQPATKAAAFVEFPAAAVTRPAEPAVVLPRSETKAQQPRAPGPLNIVPQAQQSGAGRTAAASPAPAPSSLPPSTKRTTEVLTAAAIAALIVAESRRAYYATGHPCACPDDSMRNGHRCGGRSAYSRPGGAAPLCFSTDVTEAMIKSYRARIAER